jgi:hypothetical protein
MLKAKIYDVKILNKNRHVKVESGDQKQQEKKKGPIYIFWERTTFYHQSIYQVVNPKSKQRERERS